MSRRLHTQFSETLEATGAIGRGRGVKWKGPGRVEEADTAAEQIIGVARNSAAKGGEVVVDYAPNGAEVEAGGAFARGDQLTVDGDGNFVKAVVKNFVAAIAREAGTDGAYVDVDLVNYYYAKDAS